MSIFRSLGEESEKISKCDSIDDKHRFLAGAGPITLDYTVFSVAIMTVALILTVENVRHRIDMKFAKRKFVKRVLEVLYEELSTLGIVESIIFLVVKYNSNESFIEKETIFAEIHFMLFYTTIFNAIQSCLVAYGSKRISKNLWVKSEAIDLEHYSAIRREFDVLDTKFKLYENDDFSDGFLGFGLRQWKRIMVKMYHFIKSPISVRNHNAMNVVVRFHEIRNRFISENNLPGQFKVSRYLKNCERDVFLKLVHIPNTAWIGLIAVMNLIYYFMGIAAASGGRDDRAETNAMIGKILACIFYGTCSFFVILSYILLQRTKWIFSKVFHENFFNEKKTSLGVGVMATQKELFFFGKPSFVTKSLQFTQFGFALMAGTLLIFWDFVGVDDDTSKKYEDLQAVMIKSKWAKFYFLVATYFLFYQNAKNTIPRFTLCTNMGHLINKKHLNTTLTMYNFDNEHRERELQSKYNENIEKMDEKYVKTEERTEMSQKKALSQLEQISSFVDLPVDSLPGAESKPSSRRGSRRRPLVRSLSESAALFAPFPASTQTFRNTLLNDDLSLSSDPKVNRKIGKSATTDEIPVNRKPRPRPNRKKSLSAPLNNNQSTLFMMGDKMDQKSVSSKPSLATVHEKQPDSPPAKSPLAPSKPFVNLKSKVTDSTLRSSFSDMHEGSDTEDVPEVDKVAQDKAVAFSLANTVRRVYRMKVYNMIDTVFGTLFCIFLIGMRIEILLVDSCIIEESTNSTEFPIYIAFWFECSLYIYFILSSIIFVAIHTSEQDDYRRSTIIIAEGSDIMLSILCLLILVLSEHIRCVPENEECLDFGSRSGLGLIEPFTVLIFFRLFRKSLGRFLSNKTVHTSPLRREISNSYHHHHVTINIDNEDVHHDHHHKSHSERLVKEAWARVIYEHSELAETYGIFSAEVLEVMLGLKVLKKRNVESSVTTETPSNNNDRNGIIPQRMKKLESLGVESSQNGHIEPLKVPSINVPRRDSFVSIYDSDEDSSPPLADLSKTAKKRPEKMEDRTSLKLYSPYSRLIRSMRRCVMKMPPLINYWEEVDVVLSQNEIYFFEVSDEMYRNEAVSSNEKMKLIREEMIARNGGKGLLLSDVTKGRIIAGHTNISRMKSIKVGLCNATNESFMKHQSSQQKDTAELNEYWEVSDLAPRPDMSSLEERFDAAGVNALKISTKFGHTILLRFHCDLALAERSLTPYIKKSVKKSDLKQMMPLLWCHTLVRLCGSNQLDQELPHFGGDDDEEVNDYLEEEGQTFQTRRNRIFKSITSILTETEVDESIP